MQCFNMKGNRRVLDFRIIKKELTISVLILGVVFLASSVSATGELALKTVELNEESLTRECSDFLKSGEKVGMRVRLSGGRDPQLVSQGESLSEYEVPGNGEFEVQCLSRSPVKFGFHGLLANPPLSTRATRFPEPIPYQAPELCYQFSVLLKATPSATGTYDCVSEDGSSNTSRKSTHLYVAGEESPHILTAGVPVKVYTSRKHAGKRAEIRLPCYTTNRTVGLKLFKHPGKEETDHEVTHNSGVKFDPVQGFLLSQYECGDVYECREDDENGSHLQVEIKCWKERNNNVTQGIEFETNREQFVCKGATEMSLVQCSNLVECELMKSCGQIPEKECFQVGQDFPCGRGERGCRSIRKEKGFRGRVICRNDFGSISRQVFSDAKGKPAYNMDFITGQSSMPNRVWINAVPVEGEVWRPEMDFSLYERGRFSCNVSRLIGGDNLEWVFRLKNGTKLPAFVSNETLQESKEIFSSTADISFNHSEIMALICRAPKLYSEGWLEDEHSIVISEFRQLAFLHSSETELRDVIVGEVESEENFLECRATGTDLFPMSWSKNGHDANGNHNLKSFSLKNHTWISMLQMTYDKTEYGRKAENMDTYVCTVMDVLGQTLNKTFEIHWHERSFLPQLSLVVALLFLAFMGIMTVTLVVMKRRWTDKAVRKIMKEFMHGKKPEGDAKVEDGKGESNPFLALPYDTKFEIKNPDKSLVRDREIGSGNFGKVHLYTLTPGQGPGGQGQEVRVAVKELPDSPPVKQLEDFLNEIKLLQSVGEHPNVVRFIGAVTSTVAKDLKPKIVLEYCELGDIKSYLKNLRESGQSYFEDELNPVGGGGGYQAIQVVEASFPQTPAGSYSQAVVKIKTSHLFQWCFQISCGMEHLANIGILHRDLAARNVLLTGNLTAKVADFGLAKDLQKTEKRYYSPSCAFKDEVPARWVALECLKEHKFSTYSDVWSMGVTMWEIFNLCEFIPWNHVSDEGLIQNLTAELEEGKRLCKPKYANDEIYNAMYDCWEEVKMSRPSFSELKKLIFEAAGNLSVTPGQSLYTETDSYSSLTEEELQLKVGDDGSGSLTTPSTTRLTTTTNNSSSSAEGRLESEV